MSHSSIYVVTDREYTQVREPGYHSLKVKDGSMREVLGMINRECEEAAPDQCIGICFFDAYFVEGGRLLSLDEMERKCGQYDVLLPEVMPDSGIGVKEPQMMVVRKAVLDRYCDESRTDQSGCETLATWAKRKRLRIGTQRAECIDTSRMAETYRRIEELTRELVASYQAGKTLKLPRLDPTVGADGRMPVWICWWQGEEQAPGIVKKCLQSIRRNLPEDKADIRLITWDNYRQYVTFSETIEKRFRDGVLSMTHLSDVLRAQLLCRYGGLWVDATCMFWDDRFAEALLQYPFYTRKKGGAYNELDIVSGRWATYFVKGPAGFPLFGFWAEAFALYWENYDSLLNYFLFDYITAVAYENIAQVKMVLDAVPVNNAAAEVLAGWGNLPFDQKKMDLLTSECWLFKMTYKTNFTEKTPQGEETFYHAVMRHLET